jgi:hypothetical protein
VITWTPKMCERCNAKPAVWACTTSVTAVLSRAQSDMTYCDDCSTGGGDYTIWTSCDDLDRVETLWLMHCAAPPMTAYQIEKAARWERETRHAGKALTMRRG